MSSASQDSSPARRLANDRPAQILIVDDNDSNILILERMLQKLGYNPQSTDNGRQAFSFITGKKYDLILMDIMMPGIDGLELTRAIRNAESAQNPIIVAVTADVTAQNRDACFLAGVDDFLPKPVDFQALTAMIESWVPRATS
ncbi:MAG TPA: response regulator [Turneriella sp.]|nr:response regulator [Turneriella sp.]